ncbi:MAG: HupE/UreJ family protein, partial [Ferruginibacter sp.]
VLSAVYTLMEWKKVLVLVTAFTIGHAITVTLSILDIIRLESGLAEFLIALTIVITSFINLINKKKTPAGSRMIYGLALSFGLIHGLGFAGYLRFMLAENENLGMALFGFNTGLETGQVIIVFISLFVQYGLTRFFRMKPGFWINVISLIALFPALYMCITRFPISYFTFSQLNNKHETISTAVFFTA